jgi:hypothetical protein
MEGHPAPKLERLVVRVLAGAKTVSPTGATLRSDPAVQVACGRPGRAEPATIAATPALPRRT